MPSVPDSLPSRLGLIAGAGAFPRLVLEEARRLGIETLTLAIKDEADPALEKKQGEGFHWLDLGEVTRSVRLLREAGIAHAVMAGRVRHIRAFSILKPDRLMLKILARLPSRTTDAMLKTLADVLAEEGIELVDSISLLGEHLAAEGPMGKRRPSREDLDNARFGLRMARGLAALDIGQTVVVKQKAVVTAEAMEGTDAAIRRAGDLVDGPFVVVKVARPDQDLRFDVPTVGPGTIQSMAEAGAAVLALETGRVLMLGKREVIEEADEAGVAVYGVSHE